MSTAEPAALTLSASAESRLAASSNEDEVRVEGLEEQDRDGAPAQGRHLLDLARGDLLEAGGEGADALDRGRLEVGRRQEGGAAAGRADGAA